MCKVYMHGFMQVYVGLSRQAAMSVHTLNMVLYMVLVPVGGVLADRFGFLPLLSIPSLLMTFLGWPLWLVLSRRDSIVSAFEGQVGHLAGPESRSVNSVSLLCRARVARGRKKQSEGRGYCLCVPT
jgi:MHS family proline/betaine transporter-like MFS transporter